MSNGINPNIKRHKKTARTADQYLADLSTDDRYTLSEVLTLVESTGPDQQAITRSILADITDADSKQSLRIGITGSPGAGKSTLIEQLGLHYLSLGSKVAVLAIDPSSTKSDGSILGDKTRMPLLSNNPDAYIRPTASATTLGGVSKTTKESIAICEKAGYDVIIIESVGVGQSEVALADMVDVYVLVLLPGGGDDVQGIKRGVVEMADILLINKADGDRLPLAKQSKKDFEGSVRLFSHELDGWTPPVSLVSALTGDGVSSVSDQILAFIKQGKQEGYFNERRKKQKLAYLQGQIHRFIEEVVEKEYNIDELTKADEASNESVFVKAQDIISDISKRLHG